MCLACAKKVLYRHLHFKPLMVHTILLQSPAVPLLNKRPGTLCCVWLFRALQHWCEPRQSFGGLEMEMTAVKMWECDSLMTFHERVGQPKNRRWRDGQEGQRRMTGVGEKSTTETEAANPGGRGSSVDSTFPELYPICGLKTICSGEYNVNLPVGECVDNQNI